MLERLCRLWHTWTCTVGRPWCFRGIRLAQSPVSSRLIQRRTRIAVPLQGRIHDYRSPRGFLPRVYPSHQSVVVQMLLRQGNVHNYSSLILVLLARQINRLVNPAGPERKDMRATSDMRISGIEKPPRPSPALLQHGIVLSLARSELPAVHSESHCHFDGLVQQHGAILWLIRPVESNRVEQHSLDIEACYGPDSCSNSSQGVLHFSTVIFR